MKFSGIYDFWEHAKKTLSQISSSYLKLSIFGFLLYEIFSLTSKGEGSIPIACYHVTSRNNVLVLTKKV